MEMNQLMIVVTFLVVYQQDPQTMYQKLLIFLYMNIILKIEPFIWVLLVVKIGRSIIQDILPSPIINKMEPIKKLKIAPKQYPTKESVVDTISILNTTVETIGGVF